MITLAADIGGTRIKLGIVRDQSIVAQARLDARSGEGLESQLPRIAATFAELCAGANIRYGDCEALGVAFPSIVAADSGRVLTSYGKYSDAPLIDLRGWAREAFDLRLAIDNDARVAQLGEWRAGAGRGCDDFVMLTLGTGLGTSAVIGGQLLRGKHAQAGVQGGHMTVRRDGVPCVCGNRGCAETEASTAALPRIARQRKDFAGSALRALDRIDYAAVFRLARENDACAAALREDSLEVWSALIVSLIHAYDPERVVVGGGVIAGAPECIGDLEQRVRARAHTVWGQVDVVPAQLGDTAALIGADWLVRETQDACAG